MSDEVSEEERLAVVLAAHDDRGDAEYVLDEAWARPLLDALVLAERRIMELERDICAQRENGEDRERLELELAAEREARDQTAWICEACLVIYPGPPQPGLSCVVCPKCDAASTMPMTTHERRVAERRADAAEAKLASVLARVRGFGDEWGRPGNSLTSRGVIADAVRAAVPEAFEGEEPGT